MKEKVKQNSRSPKRDIAKDSRSISLEGRVVDNAEKRQIQTKNGPLNVVKFSVEIENDLGEVKLQSCTVYGKDIEITKAGDLKKGDGVKMEGDYSKVSQLSESLIF